MMLAQKLVLSYYSRILSQIIQVGVGIVVARVAGPTVLGTVAFGLAFVNMFQFLADLGVGSAHIKLISEGRDEATCIGTYSRIKLVLIGFFFIVVLGVFLIQKYIFHHNFESVIHEQVILICLVSLTISQIFFIPKTTFMARIEQAKQDIPDFIQVILLQSLRLIVVLLGYRALAIAFSKLVSTILMIPVFFFLFKDYKIGKFDRELAKIYISIALPLIVVVFANTLLYWADKVILQYLTNSEEVGYYVAGFRIGGFIKMIGSSIGLMFFPLFSKAIQNKEFDLINTHIKKFESFSLAFVYPVVIFVALYSDMIVQFVLGPQYIKSIPILSIIIVSVFIRMTFGPYGNVVTGIGLFKLLAKLYLVQMLFFIIAAFVLASPTIFDMKGVGIALGLLLSNILLAVLFMTFSKKNLKQLVVLPSRSILIFGLIYAAMVTLIYKTMLVTMTHKIIFIPIFFFFYFFVSSVLGIIKKQDWMLLKNLVNVKKMIAYIKSEL